MLLSLLDCVGLIGNVFFKRELATDYYIVQVEKSQIGVLVGSAFGGLTAYSDGVKALLQKDYERITPFFVPFNISNMGCTLLAIDMGLMGPTYSVSTTCAIANYCLYVAVNHIRRGEADIMLAGGKK